LAAAKSYSHILVTRRLPAQAAKSAGLFNYSEQLSIKNEHNFVYTRAIVVVPSQYGGFPMQTLEARLSEEQQRFVEELQVLRRALPRRAAEHPFVLAMMEGRATEEQVRVQCIQQYFHTIAFPAGLARLVSRCGIPEIRREITEGLYEEETGKLTGTAPHLDLYYRYARSWGYTPEQLRSAYMLP
jgi:hypothetical protein